jgi:hypothetical protein
MSKFLRIKNGVCICVDKVEALETIDQLNTRIYMTNGGVYEAMFPYETLLTLLQIDEAKPVEQVDTKILEKLTVLADNSQHFAG